MTYEHGRLRIVVRKRGLLSEAAGLNSPRSQRRTRHERRESCRLLESWVGATGKDVGAL